MALTPEELKSIPERFINLYQELENFIIADIARRIAKVSNLTDSAKLETIRANEVGISLNLIKEKIKETSGLTEEKINEIFNDAGVYSISKENELYSEAGLNTVKITENAALENIINAAIKQTSGELYNLTKSVGFAQKVNGKVVYKHIAKYYHDAMDLAVMQIKSGSTNYNTAIKQAVDKLCESGIRSVDYESGVANRIDVAIRRAVLTGSNQMSQKLTLEGMKELGCDFVETTAHIGARPSHAIWQGKVFCYSGNSIAYPPFIESTGYGTGPGLGGWNCRHSFYPFIPGVSVRAYSDEALESIDPPPFIYNGTEYTYYEATQHQRAIERSIRKTKTKLIGYNAAGLTDEFTNTSIKLKQQEKYYREFSKAADILTEKDRLQVHRFDKSISQKSVWASNKAFIQSLKELGIPNPPKSKKEFDKLKLINPREYKLMDGYILATKKGDISVLIGYDTYKKIAGEIEEKLIGITTKNGIIIEDYAVHFIDRVIGGFEESNYIQSGKRKGVKVDSILETLLNPKSIGDTVYNRNTNKPSIVFKGLKLDVSINPETGTLIQTNPIKGKGK
ncbi:MAG: phage minor capsid protein [Terrisporobacter sp.]